MVKPPKKQPAKKPKSHLPSRDEVIRFIEENPKSTGKREIGRAFGIKGSDRIWLKQLLRELQDDGVIQKRAKTYAQPGDLPPVTVLDIKTRDRDGGLIARPVQWNESVQGAPPNVAVSSPRGNRGKVAGVGDRILAKISKSRAKPGSQDTIAAWVASVIKILPKQRDSILGVYRANDKPDTGGRLEGIDRRQQELEITAENTGDAKDGDVIEVATTGSARYGLQQARVLNVVGSLDSEHAISMIALHAHDIPHIFDEAVLESAQAAQKLGEGAREDWRKIPFITIDPATAKDHDDAVFAEADSNPANEGGHVVSVAIADVSWYVRHGTPLDREAEKRGNSVYFPDRVVPMLPEIISNDLCSLKQGADRCALAVRMIFSSKGHKISHKFHRVLIKNHTNLSYQAAQSAINGQIEGADSSQVEDHAAAILDDVLIPLWDAWHCMTIGRNERQPLELDMPERRIVLDKDGKVDRVETPPRLDAHKLIEECMIQANVAAAETLEQRRQPLIYRIHDAPTLAKLESLREFLKGMNISLPSSGGLKPSNFNGILAKAAGTDSQQLVNQVVLRSQSQAEYNPDNIGHFGLNLHKYAHFTSPIRRYADLIVHRALVGSLGLGEGGLTSHEESRLDVIASEISQTERRAMVAERDTKDRLIASFLNERVGATFKGRINGVTRSGLFVTLTETGADGFVPISTLGDEYFIYDEASHSVFGEKSATGFQMGNEVEVKLVEALPLAGSLQFEMISDGVKLGGLPRSRHKSRRSDQRANQSPGQRPGKRKPGGKQFGKKRGKGAANAGSARPENKGRKR